MVHVASFHFIDKTQLFVSQVDHFHMACYVDKQVFLGLDNYQRLVTKQTLSDILGYLPDCMQMNNQIEPINRFIFLLSKSIAQKHGLNTADRVLPGKFASDQLVHFT